MKRGIKRLLDLGLSLLGLVVLSPVLLMTWILVRVKLGSPAIYTQERPGKNGKIFTLYKFRTMTDSVDENGNIKPDEERMTVFGRKLRSTSLDELPELWNIFRGDMSLVGPRPLLVRYLDRYTAEQARRHDVRPGLTGWAQVNGRNAISWEQRFEMDVWYVDNWSLLLDLKIIVKTFATVFKREGISKAGEATMTEFMGSREVSTESENGNKE